MRKLLLFIVLAASAFSSGCDGDDNDPDPYLYSSAGISENGGSFSNSGGF